MTTTPHPKAVEAARALRLLLETELRLTLETEYGLNLPPRIEANCADAIARICFPPIADGEVRRVVDELNDLQSLEGAWYANGGRKTGERCCAAMREAAAMLEAQITENRRLHNEWALSRAIENKHSVRAEAAEAQVAVMRRALTELIEPLRDCPLCASDERDKWGARVHKSDCALSTTPAAPDQTSIEAVAHWFRHSLTPDYRALAEELAQQIAKDHGTLLETKRRLVRYGKATNEIDAAISEAEANMNKARAAGILK